MEHPGEVWQEFDFNGERLGGLEPEKCYDTDFKMLGGVAIMFYRFNNGKVEFLFQHRSKNLRANPDMWDVSAGGHINLNEPKLDTAVRETREEIGVEIDKSKLEYAVTMIREIMNYSLYFYDWTGKEDNFSFDDAEVQAVKWISEDEIDEFWSGLKKPIREDRYYRMLIDEQIEKIKSKYGNN